tara:strand:+ start:142 stop:378 length:237 start_codon:yes stop_codon:yes gene_type:complete
MEKLYTLCVQNAEEVKSDAEEPIKAVTFPGLSRLSSRAPTMHVKEEKEHWGPTANVSRERDEETPAHKKHKVDTTDRT